MYIYKHNDEACSCNHCCRQEAVSITYSECVCSLSHPTCSAHAHYVYPVWLNSIYPHYLIKGMI